MKPISLVLMFVIALLAAGCASSSSTRRGEFDSRAVRPKDPKQVRVKVSLKNQMLYVLEGERPLLVTPTCVGTAATPTPKGTFTIFSKQAKRRAYTRGFWVHDSNGQIRSGRNTSRPSGKGWRFVGYPMGYWCEFAPAYGIHAGWVHPAPRTHGCLRIHRNVAPKFFALVSVGTKVEIANTHPEDATLGNGVARPQDYDDPEYPPEILFTDKVFERATNSPLFEG